MANFPKMQLTSKGLELLTNVQAGADNLIFTKTALGDGVLSVPVSTLTNLVSIKAEIPISEGKAVGTNTYQIGAFFNNTEITTGFWWREIGVFAKGNNGTEILYCYSNAGDAGDYIPVGSDERIEKYIYQSLAIGNSTNVTAEINGSDSFILSAEKGKPSGVAPLGADGKIEATYLPEMDYVATKTYEEFKTNTNSAIADAKSASTTAQSNLDTHTSNKRNPHGVTAEQVGAISKTIKIDGKDILGIVTDGWYYGTNIQNVPTDITYGYVRVRTTPDSKYREVSWRPATSFTEFTNVLSNGTWLGWTETFTNKGGTVSGILRALGSLEVKGPIYTHYNGRGVYATPINRETEKGFEIQAVSCDENGANKAVDVYLMVTQDGFKFVDHTKGKLYNIFGEHNKPKQTYEGNASSRTINIGGVGNVLCVMGVGIYTDNQKYTRTHFVTPDGVTTFDYVNSTTSTPKFYSDTTFKNGILTIGTQGVSAVNVNLVTYYCYVL